MRMAQRRCSFGSMIVRFGSANVMSYRRKDFDALHVPATARRGLVTVPAIRGWGGELWPREGQPTARRPERAVGCRGQCSTPAPGRRAWARAAAAVLAVEGAMLCQGPGSLGGHELPGEGARECQRTKTLKTPFSRLALSLRVMGGTAGLTAAAPSTAGAGGASGTPAALAAPPAATARRAGGGTGLSWAARGGRTSPPRYGGACRGGQARGGRERGGLHALSHRGRRCGGGCLLGLRDEGPSDADRGGT